MVQSALINYIVLITSSHFGQNQVESRKGKSHDETNTGWIFTQSVINRRQSAPIFSEIFKMSKIKNAIKESSNDTVREMTVKMLAKEFLAASEISYDLRAYQLEKVLPTLALALEGLCIQVEKRHLAGEPADVAPAAENAKAGNFNPINWLGRTIYAHKQAQYLYRNNPRFSDEKSPSLYTKGLVAVADEIRERIAEIKRKIEEEKLLEEQRLKKLKEEAFKVLQAQIHQRRKVFQTALGDLFSVWCDANWRDISKYEHKRELVK
jgi:hypothetical protein